MPFPRCYISMMPPGFLAAALLFMMLCTGSLIPAANASPSGSSCQRTESYLQSILQQSYSSSLTYAVPKTSSSNKCRISDTCCTASAESKLQALVETKYETKLYKKLNSTISQCLGNSIQSSAAKFIDTTKAFTISSVQSAVGNTLTIDEGIINEFYDYLKNGILTLQLNELEAKFKALYLKVFLATFREILESKHSLQLVTSEAFETCFYTYVFNIYFGGNMNTDYNRFKERFNLFFRLIWAVNTADEVLNKILNHTLSSNCKESLLRMDHCSQCSTHQDMPTNTLACHSMCLNSLRGCLVDLMVFGSSFEDHVDKLEDAKARLDVFDPFDSVNLLSNRLNGIVTTTSNSFDSYKITADVICMAQYTSASGKKRRSTSSNHDNLLSHRAKRQSAESPKSSIDDTITCLSEIPGILKGLSGSLCGESTSVSTVDYNCWNGSNVDSYWWTVMESDRINQATNPELNIEADTGLLYKDSIGQLNIAFDDLEQCRANVRTCNEKLSSFTSPNGSQYDFADSAEFQPFTQLGFPEPQIASVIPVDPSNTNVPSVHVTIATPISSATPLPSTTMMANMQDHSSTSTGSHTPPPQASSHTLPPQISSHTPLSSSPSPSSSDPPRVRPTPSKHSESTSAYTKPILPSFTPFDNGVPDRDKPSESKIARQTLAPERISGSCVVSVSSTIILLLTTLVMILTVILL